MKMKKHWIIMAMIGLITSCESVPSGNASYDNSVVDGEKFSLEDYKEDDKVLRHLIHSARDIQRQWGGINQLTELRTGTEAPILELSRTDPSLKRVFSFPSGFQGTLDNLVKVIAQTSGYNFLPSLGKKPIRGVDIIFVEEMRTLAEYLFDAGVQAGDRADVVIDMKSQTLQIVYKGY
jgi:hypothetical protein